MVPQLSIVFMAVACAVSVILPVALFVYLRKRKNADVPPFFFGFAVFILFATILEAMVHKVVLGLPIGDTIKNTTWLYAAYGGLMAGLFEETGRYLAFRTVMKRYGGKDVNALMYGAGHGGVEAMLIVGLAMVSNITVSMMINSGKISDITSTLSGDALEQMEAAIDTLVTTPSWQFLLAGVERISAIVSHISLSVLVWFSVFGKKRFVLFPIAILLHAAVDAAAVVFQSMGLNTAALEAVILLLTVMVAVNAYRVWKDNHTAAVESPTEE